MKANKNLGGARPGSGRKWEGHVKKKQMLVYLSVEIAEYIDSQTKLLEISRGKVIDVIISNYVQDTEGEKIEIY